ncbi:MAG: hypothetical protein ACSLFQ_00930 [Thermoanaerobaculia bacterium]
MQFGFQSVEALVHAVEAPVHAVEALVDAVEARVRSVEALIDAIEASIDPIKAQIHPFHALGVTQDALSDDLDLVIQALRDDIDMVARLISRLPDDLFQGPLVHGVHDTSELRVTNRRISPKGGPNPIRLSPC